MAVLAERLHVGSKGLKEARRFNRWERPQVYESTAIHLVSANIEHAKTVTRDGRYYILFTTDGYRAYIDPAGQPARDCPVSPNDERNHQEYELFGDSTVFNFREVIFPRLMRESGVNLRSFMDETIPMNGYERRRRTYGQTRDGLVFVPETSGLVIPRQGKSRELFMPWYTRYLVKREPQRPRRVV